MAECAEGAAAISPALTDAFGLRRVTWQKTFPTPTGLHRSVNEIQPFQG
jgi:hypothetical protein